MFFFTLVGFNFVCMSSFTKGVKGAWQMTITRMVIVLKNNNNNNKKRLKENCKTLSLKIWHLADPALPHEPLRSPNLLSPQHSVMSVNQRCRWHIHADAAELLHLRLQSHTLGNPTPWATGPVHVRHLGLPLASMSNEPLDSGLRQHGCVEGAVRAPHRNVRWG